MPEALRARATAIRIFDWNQREALRLMRQAVASAPHDVPILYGAAVVIGDNGYLDEALALAGRAIELDPISLQSYSTSARLEAAGNDVAAESLYRIACDMAAPDTFHPRFGLFLSLFRQQRFAECELMLPQWTIAVHRLIPEAMLAWARGDYATSDANLAEIKKVAAILACYQITQVHGYRGEADATFVWLEKCIEVRDPGVFSAKTDRLFRFVHGDARWKPMMKKLGFED